ncbi:hypothetical protein CYMTET_45958 [Cymbomonas tetramitiformis]|uniref:Meiosis regulator and mRNA stability factor 1 n=1 Tax=Cymbomonas tetramitiformis TaxID=36881 RepID=A0AAE0BX45_9CHLO|nr:hypothetical protein CYMTET_45958 [Cymbomonas tetramitiformis]|eukprot:gene16143-19151_t
MSKVFVGNLPWAIDTKKLLEHIKLNFPPSEVKNAYVIADKETRRSRGFGFVEFVSHQAALKACRTKTQLQGRNLRYSLAKSGSQRDNPGRYPESLPEIQDVEATLEYLTQLREASKADVDELTRIYCEKIERLQEDLSTLKLTAQGKQPSLGAASVSGETAFAPAEKATGRVAIFWDYDNCPVPKRKSAYAVAQRVRSECITEGCVETEFTCFCDMTRLPAACCNELNNANVLLAHVPAQDKNGCDLRIIQHISRFERCNPTPATVVLLSGDINFMPLLSDLRRAGGYTIAVLHSGASPALLQTAHWKRRWFDLLTALPDTPSHGSKESKKSSEIPGNCEATGAGARALVLFNLNKSSPVPALRKEVQQVADPLGGRRYIVVADHRTGLPKGYGFVEFATHTDADRAYRRLKDVQVCGQPLRVEWAKPKGRQGGQQQPARHPQGRGQQDTAGEVVEAPAAQDDAGDSEETADDSETPGGKQEGGTAWLLDAMVDFVAESERWHSSIQGFMIEQCEVFEDSEENKLEHTLVHQEFQLLMESLLEEQLEVLGVTGADFAAAIAQSSSPEHQGFLEQVLAMDNFLHFKTMMIKLMRDLQGEGFDSLDTL